MKHALWIVLSVAIAAVALTYSLYRVDLVRVGSAMATANFLFVLPFLGVLIVEYLLTATDWVLLLRPVGRFTLSQVLPAILIGFAGNNLFPMRLGELMRAVVFARQRGRPLGSVLASIMLERILDVLAILLLFLLSLFVLSSVPSAMATGAKLTALALLPLCIAIGTFLLWPAPFVNFWQAVSAWLPEDWRDRGTRLIEGVLKGLSTLRSPPRLLALACIALLKWTVATANVWLTLQAFHSGASFGVAMVVLVVTALAVALPGTPGFVGTLQAAFVIGLAPFGISPDVAFAASVFYMVAGWVPTTLLGLGAAALLGLHFFQMRREVAQAEREAADGSRSGGS